MCNLPVPYSIEVTGSHHGKPAKRNDCSYSLSPIPSHIPSLRVASQPASKQKQEVIAPNKAENSKYSFISRGEEKNGSSLKDIMERMAGREV